MTRKFSAWFSLLLLAFLSSGCRDYSNRLYLYKEYIPLNPFVLRVMKTDYRSEGEYLHLRVDIEVHYKPGDTGSLDLNRFVLRTVSTEIRRMPSSQGDSANTVPFSPNQTRILSMEFSVPISNASSALDLIVDQGEIKGRKTMSLVRLKNSSTPPPSGGEWRTVESDRW